MSALAWLAATFLVLNVLQAGILLGQVGQSTRLTYGERWFCCLLGLAVWAYVFVGAS